MELFSIRIQRTFSISIYNPKGWRFTNKNLTGNRRSFIFAHGTLLNSWLPIDWQEINEEEIIKRKMKKKLCDNH